MRRDGARNAFLVNVSSSVVAREVGHVKVAR